MTKNNSLGCGYEIKIGFNKGAKCGVANAWGKENLCKSCDSKLRNKWRKEDDRNKYLKTKKKELVIKYKKIRRLI